MDAAQRLKSLLTASNSHTPPPVPAPSSPDPHVFLSAVQQEMQPFTTAFNREIMELKEIFSQHKAILQTQQREIDGKMREFQGKIREEANKQKSGVEILKRGLEKEGEEAALEGKLREIEEETAKIQAELREYEEIVVKTKVKLTNLQYTRGQLRFTLTNLKFYPLQDLSLHISSDRVSPQILSIPRLIPEASTQEITLILSLSQENSYFAQVFWQDRPLSTREVVTFTV